MTSDIYKHETNIKSTVRANVKERAHSHNNGKHDVMYLQCRQLTCLQGSHTYWPTDVSRHLRLLDKQFFTYKERLSENIQHMKMDILLGIMF